MNTFTVTCASMAILLTLQPAQGADAPQRAGNPEALEKPAKPAPKKPSVRAVESPEKSDAPVKNQSVIEITADGSVVLNTKKQTLEQFTEKVTALAKIDPDYCIILRGDKDTPYKHVARVLEICQGAGIWNVALTVSKPD